MGETTWLADRFEENRSHLRAVAYRMLGSTSEADDAVQEAWLRLSRADTSDVENLEGWLTTVISRVCLDMLRARTSRREEPIGEERSRPVTAPASGHDPEDEAIMADSVGAAMMVVLDTLSPAERLAFVLHDTFGVPFEEIAPIVDRSPAATRQLASRARRRVQGAPPQIDPDHDRQREIVSAFLAAARDAEFDALLSLLDPDVMVRADRVAAGMGGRLLEATGATAVARTLAGRAYGAQPALIDGMPGVGWLPGGTLRGVMVITFKGERIAGVDLIGDPERLAEFDIEILGA
ncbi:MAG TPA: sigma-70 family RNA polymerase sigma factor [Thermomicrobiales bacterium]|nr:sigma-70 family RNA polymerase sigma factor [Thermomicrobiales bacterium]